MSNLVPFGPHDDVRLWDALRRSYLVDDAKRSSYVTTEEARVDDGKHQAQYGMGATTPNSPWLMLDLQRDRG